MFMKVELKKVDIKHTLKQDEVFLLRQHDEVCFKRGLRKSLEKAKRGLRESLERAEIA